MQSKKANQLKKTGNILKNIGFFLILILVWQILSTLKIINNNLFPSPIEIIGALKDNLMQGDLLFDSLSSLKRVIVGVSIAALMGICLGFIIGFYSNRDNFFKILIELLRPIPPIAWIPLAILIFGLGDSASYFIVFLGSFFPIFSNTFLGAASFPNSYRRISQTLEIKPLIFFGRILIPYSASYILTGLKIGVGIGWMSVIASELIGAQSGLGYFIQINRLLLRMDNVIAGMLMIGFIGYGINFVINLLENRILEWKKITNPYD